jgi:hypothetical protein
MAYINGLCKAIKGLLFLSVRLIAAPAVIVFRGRKTAITISHIGVQTLYKGLSKT